MRISEGWLEGVVCMCHKSFKLLEQSGIISLLLHASSYKLLQLSKKRVILESSFPLLFLSTF